MAGNVAFEFMVWRFVSEIVSGLVCMALNISRPVNQSC